MIASKLQGFEGLTKKSTDSKEKSDKMEKKVLIERSKDSRCLGETRKNKVLM